MGLFDDTTDLLPSRSDVLPVSSGLPAGGNGLPVDNSGPSGTERFAQILRLALPAFATAYALKSGGGLGEFSHGLLQAEDFNRRARADEAERQFRQDAVRRQIADEARRQAHENRLEAQNMERITLERQRVQQQEQAARDKSLHDALVRAVDKASQNPDFFSKVNEVGPESYAISVPGFGNISLKDAFDKIGVIKGPEGYAYGAPPKKESPRLITGVGPGGAPTRVEDKPGVRVYEKPEKPEKPERPRPNRTYTWKDNDIESDTYGQSFRITEDADGNEISRRPLTAEPKMAPSHAPAAPGKGRKIGRFIVEQQ